MRDLLREPDQQGPAARAWLIDPDQFPPAPAFLSGWLLTGKGFHMAWDTWMIQTIHLREVEGADPPVLHYPEAGYEVIIFALDPGKGPYDPDRLASEHPKGLPFLRPYDLVKQFHGCTDEQAGRLVGLMVREICAGRLSPDQDYRSVWEQIIDSTVAHYRAGLHRES